MCTLEKSPNKAAVFEAVPPEFKFDLINEKYPFNPLSALYYNEEQEET